MSATAAAAAAVPVPSRRGSLDPRATAAMVVLCALWGLQQVAVKVAVARGLPPALQVGLRSGISAALVCAWVGLRGGRPALRQLLALDRTLLPGVAIGLIFSVEFLLVYLGLARTTASRAVLFFYTAPFFVAGLAHLFIPAERLRLRQVAGLACAFAGVGLAVLGHGGTGPDAAGGLLGDAMVTAGAALWACNTVIVKTSPALRAATPAKSVLYQVGISAPIMLAASAALGEWPLSAPVSPLAWALLAYQGAIVAFATYLVWFWLVVRYPAGKLSAFTFLTPLFGLVAGVVLLGEPASPALLGALGLVAAGLVLVNRGKG